MGTTQGDRRKYLTFGSENTESKERLRELVLFISDRCENDPTFGVIKLSKILFFSDFFSFAEHGRAITGVPYKKYGRGPVPTVLERLRDEMEQSGEIAIRKKRYLGGTQHRVIPLREPDLDKFNAHDIVMVEQIIEALWGRGATEVSGLSRDRAWRNASEGETIPYEAAFVSDEPLTEHDKAIAEEMITEYERFEKSAGRS